ncbi:MAG: AraC family transcriptional regulator [Clostridia bacterium]|nr:AraC family transcriptional regulator [Deltaproteobacteria bacterium]
MAYTAIRFKQQFRIAPVVYRRQVRLVVATRRILAGGSISVAAHEACFSDAAHLSRTFGNQYGVAPSAWIARVMNRAERH